MNPTAEDIHDHEECIKFFSDTLARLNEVSEAQMQSVLDIAIAAADAANTVAPSNLNAESFLEKVTALIDRMRAENESKQDAATGETSPDSPAISVVAGFCSMVNNNVNLAMQNAVANQQALNQIGISVLAEGAKIVLDAGAAARGDSQS